MLPGFEPGDVLPRNSRLRGQVRLTQSVFGAERLQSQGERNDAILGCQWKALPSPGEPDIRTVGRLSGEQPYPTV